MCRRRAAAPFALWLAVALLVGCAPSDPTQRALNERSRWQVTLLSWTQHSSGEIDASLRVSGPRTTSLSTLTIKLLMMNEAGDAVDQEWHSIDLTVIEGGGPEDVFVRIPARDFEVQGLALDLLQQPAEADRDRIPELPR